MPYYKYNENLGVYNFYNSDVIYIINSGKLIKSIRIEELSEEDMPKNIINEFGQQGNSYNGNKTKIYNIVRY